MGHHPNQLLVGRALELAQLFGQLLDQQEAPREAAIDERPVVALDPAGAEHADELRIPGREIRERLSQRRGERFETQPDHGGRAGIQQPLGRRVDAADPAVEVENDDARWRHLEHAAEELVLLGDAHAFVPEMVDHPVVDADQLVDLRLPDRQEPRRELLVSNQAQALGGEPEIPVHLAPQAQPDDERQREDGFDGNQPEGVCEKQIDSQRGEHRVQGDEIGDGAPAQAHTGISYFSKRR